MLNKLKKTPELTQDLKRHEKFLNMFREAVGMDKKTKVDPASTQPAAVAEMYKSFCEMETAKLKRSQDYQ